MPKLLRISGRLLKLIALAILAGILAFALFIGYLAIARNAALPLPALTGTYTVGRTLFNWVDSAQIDALADQGSSPRELAVWVWFPAANAGTGPAPYLPPTWLQAHENDQGAGKLIEYNYARFQTHSFEGAQLASAPKAFPVLIMQPGMGPMVSDYTILAENLASHGYIVVGINPTDTSMTVFLDGRVVHRTNKGTIPDQDSPTQADADAQRIGAVWAQDVKFTMDQLARINSNQANLFYNRLDLEQIGLWGHSFGGATAIAVCQSDPRCKAGVNMDGTPWGAEKSAPIPTPFMVMMEDYSKGCDKNCEDLRLAYLHTKPGAAYLVSIAGTRHFNFSDLPFRQVPIIRPLFAAAGYIGPIQPTRALQITNAYLVAFFDQYLKGAQEKLLQTPTSIYPEVSIEKR